MGSISLRRKLFPLIGKEINRHISQFDLNSSDCQMVVYASRDLEEWMKHIRTANNHQSLYEGFGEVVENEHREFSIFLSFWIGLWLGKWRERVKLLMRKPKLPPNLLERYKKARNIYGKMEHRKELKRMVIQRLIRHGEICMVSFIAENLIVEEIARRSPGIDGTPKLANLLPMDILNTISRRIQRLPDEKGPLVFLKIKPLAF